MNKSISLVTLWDQKKAKERASNTVGWLQLYSQLCGKPIGKKAGYTLILKEVNSIKSITKPIENCG